MEDASEVDKRTIVIKGISYAWQKADLERAFSDIGPIRKCFLVGDKGGAHHKVINDDMF
jgi:nucleolar protein 4